MIENIPQYKNNKKIILGIFVILFILMISSMFILLTENESTQNTINIIQSAEDVEISMTEGEIESTVEIQDPNGDIINTLSEPGDKIIINKFSTSTEYGEYKVLNENSNVIEQFIIEEPEGENNLNITVADESGDVITNADVTVGNTTQQTYDDGVAQFYDVRLGYHMFKFEAEGYETYETNFEIHQQEMNIQVTLNEK